MLSPPNTAQAAPPGQEMEAKPDAEARASLNARYEELRAAIDAQGLTAEAKSKLQAEWQQ